MLIIRFIYLPRLCRQYLECRSFSVEWLDDKCGMCNIYNGVINTGSLVKRDQVTVYSKLFVYVFVIFRYAIYFSRYSIKLFTVYNVVA